jgi:putative endopeptidase
MVASALICLMLGFTSRAQSESQPLAPRSEYGSWGVDLSGMDKSIKPGDNFFLYANGNWFKNAVIPPDRTQTGSFEDLAILSESRMTIILKELDQEAYAQLNGEHKKLRDLYDAFEDTAQIETRGLQPIQKDIDDLQHLKTRADVARAMGSPKLGVLGIFNTGISVDRKNSNAYVIEIGESGLGLPDRDYYLRDDSALAQTRDAYRKYLAQMLALVGLANASARADKIFALETEIAKASWTRADRRNADKVYNPMTLADLEQLAPDYPWTDDFREAGLPVAHDRRVVVREKSAFPLLSGIFAATPVSVWRDFLTVHYLHAYATFLPKRFDDADFAFYGTVLSGQAQQLDRAARGAHLVDNVMGEALGKLYAARYFPPEAKAKAEELVRNLLKTYAADIATLTWMSPETRAKALDKIHAFTPHIGYPEKWRDYSELAIDRDDLVGDIERANEFEFNRHLKRLDDPVDKNEWNLTPPTVNAYYRSDFNAIFFPAAILQPPFFDPNADDAVNYGAIGAVIGHEISHGFDDQGSKYTGQGLLENWWTTDDRAAFDSRTKRLSDQFDTYEPLPGLHVIGKNTMGENIADLAGLNMSLKAYRLSLGGKPAPVIDGFTGDQRYFLGFAQIWRAKIRDNAMRERVLANPHSPPEFRVIGATRNTDAWYEAFDVQPEDKYYLAPDQRVHLW